MHVFAEHPGLWFVVATLLPLVSVVVLLLAGFLRNALRASKNDNGLGKTLFNLLGGEVTGRGPAYIATAAIALAFVCSTIGFVIFLADHPSTAPVRHHKGRPRHGGRRKPTIFEDKKDERKDDESKPAKADMPTRTTKVDSKWAGMQPDLGVSLTVNPKANNWPIPSAAPPSRLATTSTRSPPSCS